MEIQQTIGVLDPDVLDEHVLDPRAVAVDRQGNVYILERNGHALRVVTPDGKIRTVSDRSGGIQGGISNGENIIFRVAFKPTATIMTNQQTVTSDGQNTEIGRAHV